MYECFRDELMAKLSSFDPDTLKKVIHAVDDVASHYVVERAKTELIVYNGSLPDVCKAYLVSRSIEGIKRTTLKGYQNILTQFFRMIPKPLDKITTNDLRVWLYNYEVQRGVSKQTLNHYRTIVSEFFHWMTSEGWIQADPSLQIKPIKSPKTQKKAMGQLELEYMREACVTLQESAIVEILYSTGCRVTELSVLKKSDVDWESKEVVLFGKGEKYRTAYLNAKAIVALKKYLDSRNDNDEHLIVSRRAPHHLIGKGGLERIVRNIAQRASDHLGVHVTPHVFRHTMATIALANGMPVQDVQRILGHANINTTMIYAEVAQADVKRMHSKCVV